MSSAHVVEHQFGVAENSGNIPIVFVLDEDVSVRASLGQLIRSEGWQPKTFEFSWEFLTQPRLLVPCCLILAFSPPAWNDLELQRQIAQERPEVPIIVISGYGDISTMVQAMKAGAVDLLVKPLNNNVLLDAIHQGLERSRAALDREIGIRDLRSRYASLSARERQVMTLVVAGLLNKQVAGQLGISEITVKQHRGRVTRKMDAHSVPALVHMASTLGLVRFPTPSALSGTTRPWVGVHAGAQSRPTPFGGGNPGANALAQQNPL
jgi:FixJ family two-component response regulator